MRWLPKATRAFVRERAKSRCEYCRAPEIITGRPFEVDHIVPQASAGGDEPEDLALCCKFVTSGRAVTFPVKIRKATGRLCYSTLAKIHGTSILISTLEGSSCWVERRQGVLRLRTMIDGTVGRVAAPK